MNKLRIERSKELLQNTTLSIHAIGEKFGFCSSSYFAECFRKYTGCSPADLSFQITAPMYKDRGNISQTK